jgi:hypothetical protein
MVLIGSIPLSSLPYPGTTPHIPRKHTLLDAILTRSSTPTVDEFTTYLKEPVIVVPPTAERLNPIEWWSNHRSQFPTHSQMALDLLSIAAMSAECEQVFSGAGLLVNNRKRRMKEDIIEAIECLRFWWK